MKNSLLKKYIIKRKLRSIAGYIDAYLAYQPRLGRRVELRLLDRISRRGRDENFLRFKREFKALARLDHPGVIRLLDVGYTKTRIYYTTEYRDSITMEQLLKKRKEPFGTAEVLETAQNVADALAHIHEHGILHRNISTNTVYYDLAWNRAFIADFSVIRDLENSSLPPATATARLNILPTPELFNEIRYDELTDLYLFGLMLYRLATGTYPFPVDGEGKNLPPDELFEFDPPSTRRPELGSDIDDLVMGLLARDREDRFPSAMSFLQRLKAQRSIFDAQSRIIEHRRKLLDGFKRTLPCENCSRPAQGLPAVPDLILKLFEDRRSPVVLIVLSICLLMVLLLGAKTRSDRLLPPEQFFADETQALPLLRIRVGTLARTLSRQGIIKENFLFSWQVLSAYYRRLLRQQIRKHQNGAPVSRSVEQPAGRRYSRLLQIKLEFYRNADKACRDLADEYRRFLSAPGK